MTNKYYSELCPQSIYRKPGSYIIDKDYQSLNRRLEDLKIENAALIAKLKERIADELGVFYSVLLPVDYNDKIKSDGHLEVIYSALGLS